jgi:hypothetical protein
LRETNCHPRILYPAKLSFNLSGEVRTFQDKDMVKWFLSTKPALQKILKELFHTEGEEKQERIKQERGSDLPVRARKMSNMFNSISQQNLKKNSAKSKEQSVQIKPGKKAIETQESVNTSIIT